MRMIDQKLHWTLLLVVLGYGPWSQAMIVHAQVADSRISNARIPANDEQLRAWLQNMVSYHRFNTDEVCSATGLTADKVAQALRRFNITPEARPTRDQNGPLLVLPYPGGRHPRIGFLDGAIRPQRETKVSVFTPWDDTSYVVADVPEAIWSNLGLTYLAHTHIPTIWDQQNVALPKLEWQRQQDGTLICERHLINGIVFGTKVIPRRAAVHFEMWLTNGTSETLSDLRVQNCVMLKGAKGFEQQSNDNKIISAPYIAAHSADRQRWVILAWDPVHRPWANAPCPCIHADPKFPDCRPGETQRLRGWLSFFEGSDIHGELRRIEQSGWRERPFTHVSTIRVRGSVVDSESGVVLPARVHIRGNDGRWHFADTSSPDGSAVRYNKAPSHMPRGVEVHTTLTADPFHVDLPIGSYEFRIERGKEYLPVIRRVEVSDQPLDLTFQLKRWTNMAQRRWFSGDTHVHRTLEDLPNVLLAEDLNVALPLTYWVRQSDVAPTQADVNSGDSLRAQLITVDPTHVIYPINTEYEIFRVGERRHTLGAVFVLNHKTPLPLPAPPVGPIATLARQQGAILDLDKHSWPWSLMLVPVMDVDLFELANNHVWQTEFGFRAWTKDTVPDWMNLEMNDEGFTERGWIDFGLKTYYALLNCGFRLRVTAGTASGVHPVQLGFGRVYVHLPDGFDYADWMEGLNEGRSFVTTGPMLEVTFNGQAPGHVFSGAVSEQTIHVVGTATSARPLKSIELVVNGKIVEQWQPANESDGTAPYRNSIDTTIPIEASSWVAVRCFEDHPEGRVRFAHTNPIHVDIPNRPLHPRRHEVEYFIQRMEAEIDRNQDVLSGESLREYDEALERYGEIAELAR